MKLENGTYKKKKMMMMMIIIIIIIIIITTTTTTIPTINCSLSLSKLLYKHKIEYTVWHLKMNPAEHTRTVPLRQVGVSIDILICSSKSIFL